MSLARDIADLGSSATRTAGSNNKNVVINGGMKIAQRSASSSGLGTADGYFTLDRFLMNVGATSAGRFTMSQSTVTDLAGFANALKLECTTADTSIAAGEQLTIDHRIEGQDLQQFKKGTSEAESFTVSFYAKANANATYACELYDVDNTRQITKLFNVTSSWTRIILTFPPDTSGAFDDDNALSLNLIIGLHGGSTYTSGTLNSTAWASVVTANRRGGITSFFDSTSRTLEITGLQMEVGSTATDFEHEPYSVTLSKAQRYYNQIQKGIWGVAAASGNPVFHFYPPTEMRVAPSYSLTVNKVSMGDMIAQGFDLTTAVINAGTHNTAEAMSFNFTASSFSATMTNYRPLLLESGGSFNGEIQISAEL